MDRHGDKKQAVMAIKNVDEVVDSVPENSDAWTLYHFNIPFVGSGYKETEHFNRYEEYFKDKGAKIVYFAYTQGTSGRRYL